MGVHRVGRSLAGQRPVCVAGAEVVDQVGVVAAVHQGQGDHQRLPAFLPGVLQVHDPLDLREIVDLPVGDVLGGQVIPPGPDGVVDAGLLDVDSGGQEPCPLGDDELRQRGLPLQDKVCVGLQLCVLPRLREPAVGEVLEEVGVIFAGEKGFDHLRKPDEGAVEGVDPEGHLAGELGLFLHCAPLPVAEHLRLVPVGDDAVAVLAFIDGELRPVCVGHAVFIWEFDLLPDQFDVLPAMGAGHEIMPDLVCGLHGFPDVPGLQGGG